MADNNKSIGKVALNRKLSKVLDELRDDLAKRPSLTEALQALIQNLEKIKAGKQEPVIQPLGLYLEVIETIREETKGADIYPALIHNAEVIYDNLFLFGENTPDFDKKYEIFKQLAGQNGILLKGFFDPYLFATFADKMQYLTLIQVVSRQQYALNLFTVLRSHAMEVRQFLADDDAYLGYLLNAVRLMVMAGPDSYLNVLQGELSRVQRSNGMYDIDPVRLAQVEKNVQRAAMAVESGKNVLDALERKNQEMERIAQEVEERAKETAKNAEVLLANRVKAAGEEMDAILQEYGESQKRSMQLEKEIFLKEVFADAETEMNKYRSMAKTLSSTTAAEIASLGKNADEMIGRIRSAADANGKLLDLSKRTQKDQELLAKIERLSLLNDTVLERMGTIAAEAPQPVEKKEAPVAAAQPAAAQPAEAVAAPFYTSVRKREERPMPGVNPLLDRNVPFKKRFEIAMKEKERRMKQGELFHSMFDDVLTAVMEEVNPYLIGPSGCGKTYMTRQIGEILNVELFDIGYINEEYDILGYVTAMGEYSESNFYRLYKYGGIAFCDELDNGNSKATVKLNSFLSNSVKAGYCFPGGEYVQKHPNFRVIAAGNTDGSGADMNYSTREKIEESVQQRMIPIYVGYDNRVEAEILKDYPEWFEFACAFRMATDQWEMACGIPAQGIFTTRDSYRVKNYLDNGSFTPEKIMQYEFVQTKEPEYLGFLKENIGKIVKKGSGAFGVYQLFAKVADNARKSRKGV